MRYTTERNMIFLQVPTNDITFSYHRKSLGKTAQDTHSNTRKWPLKPNLLPGIIQAVSTEAFDKNLSGFKRINK